MKRLHLLTGFGLAGTLSAIVVQPAWADVAQITAVQITPTDTGIDVLLTTPTTATLETFTSSSGTTITTDIVNAQLQLPEGDSFQQDNPAAGIESVAVTAIDANTVRVTITGETEVPVAQVRQTEQGLVVNLATPADTTAAQPAPMPDMPATDDATPDTPAPVDETIPETAPPTAEQPDAPVDQSDNQPDGQLDPAPEAQPAEPEVTQPEVTQPEAQTDADQPVRVIVTATRTEEEAQDVPRSVTVITREQLDQQTTISRNLSDILGQLVPGFGPPNGIGSSSDFQSLRGRAPAVLIDGVPLSDNSGLSRQLRTIDPASIERIEVVRGPSALYGGEATGGIINIITRTPSEEEIISTTEVGVNLATTSAEDNFGYFFDHNISGTQGIFTYDLTVAAEFNSGLFDPNGDRIFLTAGDGSLSDSDTFNIVTKFGLNLSERERLNFLFNYYNDSRAAFILDPDVVSTPGIQAARALRLEDIEIDGGLPRRRNTLFNVSYTNEDFLNSEVQAQAYYRYYDENGSIPADERENPLFGDIIRTQWNWEQLGGRLQIDTPLTASLSLLWGADYENEESEQPFDIFDPDIFDRSGGRVFRRIGEGTFVPPYELTNLGLFAQLNWTPSDRWSILGGARQEWIDFSVDDYTTSDGQDIQGGELNFDDLTFNLGTVFQASDEISLFANFAQGFSVPSFARVLRVPPTGFVRVTDALDVTEPQKVNEYEIGVRGDWDSIQASLSAFYSTSDLGTFFVEGTGGVFVPARAPERIYGIEATLDVQPSETWQFGGTVSWSEGENDEDQDDDYIPLSSATIQPIKITGYVQNETTPGWTNRLQALFVGGRDRAFDEGVDLTDIDSYVVFDFISSVALGPGTLQIGIRNLFNNEYFPVASQFLAGFDEQFNAAGVGRTVSLSYSLTW